jgi:cell division protein FtsB
MAPPGAAVALEHAVPVERPRHGRVRRARPRSRVAGGVVWIVLVAVLLAGVVALNVAVLRLNVRYDQLGRTKVDLVAKNTELSSQLSSAAATDRIQALARARLGDVPAPPDQTTYIRLPR